MRRPRLLSVLALALAAVALAACNKHDRVTTGETEGIYVDVGEMKYQVQISRMLNPADREDREYLVGVPEPHELGAEDAWFAVFVRAQNESDEPQPLADEYRIHDSAGNEFEPVEIGEENVFALQPRDVPGGEVYPLLDTAAAESTIQGSLILFKIPYLDLENRPLDLEIVNPEAPDEIATVELDV